MKDQVLEFRGPVGLGKSSVLLWMQEARRNFEDLQCRVDGCGLLNLEPGWCWYHSPASVAMRSNLDGAA